MPRQLDPGSIEQLRNVMTLARRGDVAGARATAERALARGRDQAAFWALLGVLCCQSRDLVAGIDYLRRAHRANLGDVAVAFNLASALVEAGEIRAALEICTPELAMSDPGRRLWRLRGYLLQSIDDYAAAADAYQHVVATFPDDFEAWNNLGNARAATGDGDGSIAALERAVALRPDVAPVRLNLATTLVSAGRFDEAEAALRSCVADFTGDAKPLVELAALLNQQARTSEAIDALERAAAIETDDADLQVKLGMERIGAWDMGGGEEAFARAIAIDPTHADAHVLIGLLMEHTNRAHEFGTLIASAERIGVARGAVQFIRALACRREQRWRDGLEALAEVPPEIEPVRCAHLRGQFHDRLGEAAAAFDDFTDMNRQLALDPSDPAARAAQLRAALRSDREIVTPSWHAGWRPADRAWSDRSPAFLVGFPRSGTTLLDTMLMGHPDVQVMEEEPALNHVEQALGGVDRLADIADDELAALREIYYERVRACLALRPDALLVDKSPLHMSKAPLIHRLFPDARFILALRHPCDVVLSCYITNFRLNNAMANFIDIQTSAEFYDLSFDYWERCRRILPIAVHPIAYERVVEDSAAELRPLFDYLGLRWREEVLDHRRTAIDRGVISTASYAQVTEPIYTRSSGRWTRYREQLAPVLPVLAPWAARFGYAL